jgi:hypothetical protein
MALASDAQRQPASAGSHSAPLAESRFARPGRMPESNTISASQARAARRREALSNQQAVSAWLRELSARGR